MTEVRRDSYHRSGHDTEYAAAESITEHAVFRRKQVRDVLDANPDGLTDDEGAMLLGLAHRLDFGRRRCELANDGLVYATKLRRPTPAGRNAIVWRSMKFHDAELVVAN